MDINTIAEMAGVSRATVSRYLNDGYVSAEKRERIAQVIKETGYVPSQQAKSLRTGKTNLVGVIIPKINSGSVARMVAGMTDVFNKSGYQILLANTDNDESVELDYLRLFVRNNQVDGIILVGTVITPKHERLFRSLKVPLVLCAQRYEGLPCVYHNNRDAQRDVTEVMLERSTHPAYIGVMESDEAAGRNRHQGFLDACAAHGIEVPERAQLVSDFTLDSGYECCDRLLQDYPEVDGIVCATDPIAVGAITCLREFGRRVPEDVRVSGIGDDEIGKICMPTLTTVNHHYKSTGREAARLMLEAMDEKDDVRHGILMDYEIIRRNSTEGA
jgi:LacI family sucrose operon transcriptional repressor